MDDFHKIFDQPHCEHNQAKSKKDRNSGCTRPEPGSAMGGCTYDGAISSLLPIADAIHLVHGTSACVANGWESRGSLSSWPGDPFTRWGFSTELTETQVILGGEGKLLEAIRSAVQRFVPQAVFVYSTCVTALIGEDIEAVCREAQLELKIPVIPVGAAGFLGSKNLGTRIAGEVLINHVIGTREPREATPYDVNIIGEYNIAGELWQIEELLRQVGIRLRSSITGDGRFARIQTAHRAQASMVVCSRALLNVAHALLDRYQIPFFEGSFYGKSEIATALRNFGKLLGADIAQKIEQFIVTQELEVTERLAPYVEMIKGRKALLYTGGVKSWALISALQDLGMQVVATSNRKSTQDDVDKMKALLGDEGVVFEEGGAQSILRMMAEMGAEILLAGGRNQYTAAKSVVPFIDVNQERHRNYAGYDGLVNLAQDLAREITNPVYTQLREGKRHLGYSERMEMNQRCVQSFRQIIL